MTPDWDAFLGEAFRPLLPPGTVTKMGVEISVTMKDFTDRTDLLWPMGTVYGRFDSSSDLSSEQFGHPPPKGEDHELGHIAGFLSHLPEPSLDTRPRKG